MAELFLLYICVAVVFCLAMAVSHLFVPAAGCSQPIRDVSDPELREAKVDGFKALVENAANRVVDLNTRIETFKEHWRCRPSREAWLRFVDLQAEIDDGSRDGAIWEEWMGIKDLFDDRNLHRAGIADYPSIARKSRRSKPEEVAARSEWC